MTAIIRVPWWGGWGLLVCAAIWIVPRMLAWMARERSGYGYRTPPAVLSDADHILAIKRERYRQANPHLFEPERS
jgi:hypothetical protein